MKKLFLGAAFFALLAGPSIAADIARPVYKAPAMAAVYNWTGFYVGGNVGYGWASNTDTFSFDAFQAGLSGPVAVLNTSHANQFKGVIGGGQAGYNWHVGNYVYGIETDFQGSGQKGTKNFNSQFLNVQGLGVGLVDPTSITNTDKITWFGTARGRLGYAADRWLVYATGGLAYGEVKVSGVALPAQAFAAAAVNPPIIWSGSETKVGWTIGGGVEAALAGNWTWRVEYLFMDLGKVTASTAFGPGCLGSGGACAPTTGGSGTVTTRFTDNIVRFAINYRY